MHIDDLQQYIPNYLPLTTVVTLVCLSTWCLCIWYQALLLSMCSYSMNHLFSLMSGLRTSNDFYNEGPFRLIDRIHLIVKNTLI